MEPFKKYSKIIVRAWLLYFLALNICSFSIYERYENIEELSFFIEEVEEEGQEKWDKEIRKKNAQDCILLLPYKNKIAISYENFASNNWTHPKLPNPQGWFLPLRL